MAEPLDKPKAFGKPMVRVTIAFDLDPADYGDLPHNIEELVHAIIKGEADWPWDDCDKPECIVQVEQL